MHERPRLARRRRAAERDVALVNVIVVPLPSSVAVWIRVTVAAAFAFWLIPFAVRPVRLKPSASWILSAPGVVVQSTV